MKFISSDNRGSVSLEASLVLPIFIFAMLAFFHMARLRMAESILYEAAIETVEYMAQVSYLEECNVMVPKAKLKKYIDNNSLIETYIQKGIDGVTFEGSNYLDEEGYVCLRINYAVGINVPLIGDLSGERSYVIRQKAYTGYEARSQDEELSSDEIYVYITDNREVYHMSRSCTHLVLSITPSTLKNAKNKGYDPCQLCGANARGGVLITDYGDKYHSDGNCTGLKRTVYRVKKSQVEGLGACERCGY